MTTRATATDVHTRVRAELLARAESTAGTNRVLSRAEQARLDDPLLATAAESMRAASGTRVGVDAIVDRASEQVMALLGQVNTRGRGVVSKAEVKALADLDDAAGAVVARAYELITGKRIDPPSRSGETPSAQTIDFEGTLLTQAQADAILSLVNALTRNELDHGVHLDVRAVGSILGSRPITSIAHLSALPWIGAQARDILVNHVLRATGPGPATSANVPFGNLVVSARLSAHLLDMANTWTRAELDRIPLLDNRAIESILRRRPFGRFDEFAGIPWVRGIQAPWVLTKYLCDIGVAGRVGSFVDLR